MAIERVSRYNDGVLAQIKYEHGNTYAITVFRSWPDEITKSYIDYTWKDGDSWGNLGYQYCGGAKYWWEILDINPEISDPLEVKPGDVIRIPND